MSCRQIEILPNESEIIQLRKDLFQARYDANFYKSHYQNGIAIRERMRHEHAVEVLKLRQKRKSAIDLLEETIEKLKAKVKLRERQLFGKKSEQGFSISEAAKKGKSKRTRGQKSPSKILASSSIVSSEGERMGVATLFLILLSSA